MIRALALVTYNSRRSPIGIAPTAVDFPSDDFGLIEAISAEASVYPCVISAASSPVHTKYFVRRNEVRLVPRSRLSAYRTCNLFFASRQDPITWKAVKLTLHSHTFRVSVP